MKRRKFSQTLGLGAIGFKVFGVSALLAQKPDREGIEGQDLLAAGPMVGRTSANDSWIWMYAPAGQKVEVEFSEESGGKARVAKLAKIPVDGLDVSGQPWSAHLSGLRPDTGYEYQVSLDGKVAEDWGGRFKSAPEAGGPAKFRLGLTSCMKYTQPQDSWRYFLDDDPDLHLTLGDTTYAHTTDPTIQWRHHLRYRRVPEFAAVIRNMPTYAMWDDHDFGPNNSDGRAAGKEDGLSGWNRVWINPPTPEIGTPGSFYSFGWGDVDFFVCDGRYHRSPGKAPDDESKTMLGEGQFKWLVDGLKASKAKFKLIAFGSTLHHSENDGWRLYTHSRHELFDAIKEHRIDGVVCLSGSLHNTIAWEHHESDRVGYPLVEVISSGIANSKTRSYAMLDFDTTLDDPTMRVQVIAGAGKKKLRDDKTWKLSQLKH